MPRANPLPADERRAAILAATEPLVERWGREVSTRQIAEAAGIAEGTIFRVFPSKEALIDTVIEDAFEIGLTCAEIDRIDRGLPLAERLEAAVRLLQRRMRRVIALFAALRFRPPPDEGRLHRHAEDNRRLNLALEDLLSPDRARLRISASAAADLLRTLTFASTHPMLSEVGGRSAHELVDLLLHGVLWAPVPDDADRHEAGRDDALRMMSVPAGRREAGVPTC